MTLSLKDILGRKYSLRTVLFVALAAFIWGLSTLLFNVFPYTILKEAQQGGSAVRDALTGKLPWYYIATDLTKAVTRLEQDRMQPGLTLVTGVGADNYHRIKVVDASGQAIHEWRVDWFKIWPDATHIPDDLVPRTRPGASVHGTVFLDDGSVVINFEYLGMVRLGPCGDVLWRLPYQTHHSITATERGTLWAAGRMTRKTGTDRLPGYKPPILEDTVVEIDMDGKIIREISVFDVLLRNNLKGLLYMTSALPMKGDVLHLNDVKEFPTSMAEGVFHHGDLMVSMNFVNSIVVFDPETLEARFVSTGRFAHQHDPDFVDGNDVLVFDNNYVGDTPEDESSRIELLSGLTGESSTIFAGSKAEPFYSNSQGKHQILANGNILVTEARKGRSFEIDPSGRIVWEYHNIATPGLLGTIEDSQRLDVRFDKTFFGSAAARCGKEETR